MWEIYFQEYLSGQFPAFLADKPWNYKDDLCMVGAYDLYLVTGNEWYLIPVRENAACLLKEDGTIANWKDNEHNIDKISFGKSLSILAAITGETPYREAVERVYRNLSDYPRTKTGNFWHKDIYPEQVWLDGLYMGQPFYAACLAEREERGEAAGDKWDDIVGQFEAAHRLLWDEKRGLYRHACDVSRAMDWADKETGQSPCVWLRAEGWFLMALCDVYEIAKDYTPKAEVLAAILRIALKGILKYQVPETRMFLQVVDRPDLAANYSETSGSAMVAYALMKGERLGMLPEGFYDTGSRILDGIQNTYLKKEEDGWHLYGICASAGLGPGPDNRTDRTGTAEYYLSEKQMPDNQHGAGACMMAFSERLRGRLGRYFAG